MKKRITVLLTVSVIISLLVGFGSPVNWGLVPNQQEATPQPPKGGAELLDKYDAKFVGDTSSKTVYLTFDLGYEAGYTADVLDILKANDIKAIFFLCGHYLNETELVRRMLAEGHTIGNHTDKHKDLPTLNEAAILKDIVDFDTKFVDMYGQINPDKLVFFRPPQGRIDDKSLKIAKNQGLTTLMWSIAIKDWGKDPIPSTHNANLISKRIHPGAIVLLHITNAGTPKMLAELIPMITDKGYRFGTPCQLAHQNLTIAL